MSASILDPRMIDQLKPLTVSNTNFINITSAFILVPGATSNNWTDTFNVVKDLSSDWNSTFNIVQSLSGDWEESVTIAEISSTAEFLLTTLDDFQTFLQNNSASWEESADITNILTVIESNSANWDTAYITTTALSSDFWNDVYTNVQTNSANWEESADILPTVTNYLSTELVTVSSLNVTQQLLSSNIDLINLFLTPANTLTTSICSMSGDGVTPFVMNFTNGLLTSITF